MKYSNFAFCIVLFFLAQISFTVSTGPGAPPAPLADDDLDPAYLGDVNYWSTGAFPTAEANLRDHWERHRGEWPSGINLRTYLYASVRAFQAARTANAWQASGPNWAYATDKWTIIVDNNWRIRSYHLGTRSAHGVNNEAFVATMYSTSDKHHVNAMTWIICSAIFFCALTILMWSCQGSKEQTEYRMVADL